MNRMTTPAEPVKITLERAREIWEASGAAAPSAVTYVPVFNPHVLVEGADGEGVPVNELYCLRVPSALQLMLILNDAQSVAYLDDPQIFATGSTFAYSERVPWLTFANGASRNAGQLAQYWCGRGGQYALEMAKQDIAWG